jgi:hypothetical protein
MRRSLSAGVLALSIAWTMATGIVAQPASAAPVLSNAAVVKQAAANDVIEVRWRGRRGSGAAVAAGVIGGLIIGGIAAATAPRYYYDDYYYGPGYYGPPPVVYGPAPVYGNLAWLRYCSARYRTFDPVSGTYLGYDGYRHYCR